MEHGCCSNGERLVGRGDLAVVLPLGRKIGAEEVEWRVGVFYLKKLFFFF